MWRRGWFGTVKSELRLQARKVIDRIREIEELNLPEKGSEINILVEKLSRGKLGENVEIYIGSCPDYSHNGGVYTHLGLGSGVSLLTQNHLEVDFGLLGVFEEEKIPYEMVVMIADVEGMDEYFCRKFTNGDREEFMRRCRESSLVTEREMERKARESGLKNKLRTSSFLTEFGEGVFMETQEGYQQTLMQRMNVDSGFVNRVMGDIGKRLELYRTMYPDIFKHDVNPKERESFLVGRTIRTMAQYLALGRLIGKRAKNGIIISHPTVNNGLFNDQNKFLFPGEDGKRAEPPIPVLTMKRKVY